MPVLTHHTFGLDPVHNPGVESIHGHRFCRCCGRCRDVLPRRVHFGDHWRDGHPRDWSAAYCLVHPANAARESRTSPSLVENTAGQAEERRPVSCCRHSDYDIRCTGHLAEYSRFGAVVVGSNLYRHSDRALRSNRCRPQYSPQSAKLS